MNALLRVVGHVSALLWAVVVPTLLMCFEGGSLKLATFIFDTGTSFALAIALPIYLLLRWLGRVNVYTSVLGGFLAVALPIGYLTWPLRFAAGSSASIDGVATLVNGVVTAHGWAFYVAGIVHYGLFGAAGGLTFWSLLKLSGDLATPVRPSRTRVVATSAMSVLALLVTAAIMSIPTVTADRTCHGPNGFGSIGASVDLAVEDTEWNALADVLRRYADEHQLSVRDRSEVRPNVVRILYLSICDARVNLNVNEQRWVSDDYKKPLAGRNITIRVYHPPGEESWRGLAVELIRTLQARWPGAVRLVDRGGRLKPVPEPLSPESLNTEPESVRQTK